MKADGIKPIDMRRNIPPIVNPRAGDSLGNSERDIYEALCRDEVPVVCFFNFLKEIFWPDSFK